VGAGAANPREPRARLSFTRGGVRPSSGRSLTRGGHPALERSGVSLEGRPALERSGVSPEGASGPRARRSLGDMAVYPSSEAGFRSRGAWADRFGGPPRLLRAVGPCHRAVIVLGVTYDLWARLCFVICERKWVFPGYLGDPYGCPRQSLASNDVVQR
jgi:hypothetical protein